MQVILGRYVRQNMTQMSEPAPIVSMIDLNLHEPTSCTVLAGAKCAKTDKALHGTQLQPHNSSGKLLHRAVGFVSQQNMMLQSLAL